MAEKGQSLYRSAFCKLLKNPLALVALFIIASAAFVSIFCYALAIDKTQNAALQNLVLKYKPMGYSQQMLKVPLSGYQQTMSWNDYIFGKTQDFDEIAITSLSIASNLVTYTPYIGENLQAEPKQILTEKWEQHNISIQNIESDFVYNKRFWLGTDSYGRDFYSRLLVGTRISFFVGFVAVAISLLVGIFIGALGGYYRGRSDVVIVWLINVIWSIPTLLLVMAITLAIGKGYWQIFVAVGLTMWVEVARVVRGQFLSYREVAFVEASKALGMSDMRIIFRQILPNILAPVIVISAANFAAAILIESGLSFLGIGAQPPTPSWGNIIKENYAHIILGKQQLAILPGLLILVLVLAFNIFGNALRDAMDVK